MPGSPWLSSELCSWRERCSSAQEGMHWNFLFTKPLELYTIIIESKCEFGDFQRKADICMDSAAQLFMGAGGVLTGYIIIGTVAAIGKVVGGFLLHFKFDHFIFFMIKICKKNKGFSIGLCDPQPYISCRMTDPKADRMRNLIYGAFSMAMALFITETACFQIWGTKLIPKNIFTVPMAFVMVGYTFVLMVLLAFNQKQKAGSGAAGIMRREYERCYAAIREGRAPAELEIQTAAYTGKLMDLPVYKKYLLMLYYHFLDQGDYDSLRNVMDEMEDHVPDKWSRAEMSSLCEFVFYNVIIQPNEGKAHFYGKTFLAKMEGNEEANTKRVFAYWLYFVKKDKGAALQIAMEAMKAVESYALTGCRDMEMRFIQALVKRIEQTPS